MSSTCLARPQQRRRRQELFGRGELLGRRREERAVHVKIMLNYPMVPKGLKIQGTVGKTLRVSQRILYSENSRRVPRSQKSVQQIENYEVVIF